MWTRCALLARTLDPGLIVYICRELSPPARLAPSDSPSSTEWTQRRAHPPTTGRADLHGSPDPRGGNPAPGVTDRSLHPVGIPRSKPSSCHHGNPAGTEVAETPHKLDDKSGLELRTHPQQPAVGPSRPPRRGNRQAAQTQYLGRRHRLKTVAAPSASSRQQLRRGSAPHPPARRSPERRPPPLPHTHTHGWRGRTCGESRFAAS